LFRYCTQCCLLYVYLVPSLLNYATEIVDLFYFGSSVVWIGRSHCISSLEKVHVGVLGWRAFAVGNFLVIEDDPFIAAFYVSHVVAAARVLADVRNCSNHCVFTIAILQWKLRCCNSSSITGLTIERRYCAIKIVLRDEMEKRE